MRLLVSPERAPIDEPVSIWLDGLEPGVQVAVRARMEGYGTAIWASDGVFVADPAGTIDLARDAPVSGSYEGVDPMGLFWSMSPEPGASLTFEPDQPLKVTVTAELNGAVAASATVERLIFADNVVRARVRERGLVGSYVRPKGDGSYPGVLVMGGSGGGLRGSYWQAALLARHGFAALALAYFGMASLPESLSGIPLEYFETAIAWLLEQPGLRGDGVGVVGTSRGGELVLLLGATFPRVKAVVANVPSHVVWRGFGRGISDPAPSWTLGGEPVTVMRANLPPGTPPPPTPTPGVPHPGTPGFLRSLTDREAEARASIPVERINGPVLLISGQDDLMWPSALMAARAAERLAAHHHPYPVEHLSYPDVGHLIYLPGLPTTVTASVHPVDGTLYAFGGNPPAIARASADSWPRIVRFLGERLWPA